MYIALTILAIVALPFIIALFTSPFVTIEERVTIRAPRQAVFDYIKLLRNQDNYSKWVMTDPGMKKGFQGTDGTVGFVYAWDSDNKKAGKGAQEIVELKEGEQIVSEIRFIKPFENKAVTRMSTTSVTAEQTDVSWSFNSPCNYMMRVIHLLFNLKKMLSKDMMTSLNLLKSNLENNHLKQQRI